MHSVEEYFTSSFSTIKFHLIWKELIHKPIQVLMSLFQPITKSSNDQNNDVVALEIVMF